MFDPEEYPHQRHNPLTDEWVVVSPHRTKRPWAGEVAPPDPEVTPRHSDNPLCPGSMRSGGKR